MDKPKKWTEVYPHGTKEGDEESKFFKALARHPKYDWRSTGAIAKASKLPHDRVEEIIDKYINMTPPLIFPHPKNDAHWGYWERVPDMLKDDDRDLSTKDKDNRIGKHLGADVTFLADEDDIYIDENVMADKFNLDLGPYDASEASLYDQKLAIFAENPVGCMVAVAEPNPMQAVSAMREELGWTLDV